MNSDICPARLVSARFHGLGARDDLATCVRLVAERPTQDFDRKINFKNPLKYQEQGPVNRGQLELRIEDIRRHSPVREGSPRTTLSSELLTLTWPL